jgi:anti-sigma28 factor (negative regulator of flagellin synthesis)
MVGIVGVGGLPESFPTNLGGPRTKQAPASPVLGNDALSLSPEAQTASEVARYIAATEDDQEVRQERVEQARKNIEQGTDRMNDVLRLVAGRVNRYVDFE